MTVSVTTRGDALVAERDAVLEKLAADGVPAALAGHDATLWGADAQAEASIRLGWLDCATASLPLLEPLAALRAAQVESGLDRVVLAGMGGSSLAPEVITGTYGAALTVLDTTDPGQIAAAAAGLERTVVVVSSKSGGTLETDSHRRYFEGAFRAAGIDPAERIVVVTDPGSPLEQAATEAGYRVFLADPHVGGRYSALTAFGLVPSALAGVPVRTLLDEAAAEAETLRSVNGNGGLLLGAALGAGWQLGRDKVVIADAGSGIRGFGDWAEQLIAESTGKHGRGLLPVVVEGPNAPGLGPHPDVHAVALGGSVPDGTGVDGPLGAQFLAWEYAVAVAGRVLGIDPFDQPNVQESKDNTNRVLEAGLPDEVPLFSEGPVAVFGDRGLLGDARTVAAALRALLAAVPDRGYLAVMAYLDRLADAAAAGLRAALAGRIPHPVTFGWGPRFLHSTGQYHKGGPPLGAFLQVTGAVAADLPIPGRPFTFGQLQAAQAAGDRQALESRQRPLLRLHLTERAAGLDLLLAAAAG